MTCLPIPSSHAITAFEDKIDMFFRAHVLPEFDPERIEWWFSLSGGKDSFAMAEGILAWYSERGLSLSARGFTIDQWAGSAPQAIASQLPWLNVELLDGVTATRDQTAYVHGEQAPCRICADVRRSLGDNLLATRPPRAGSVAFLARGLHLTDTAVSLAWRFALGRDPYAEIVALGKCRPRVVLGPNLYLVKPLSYAREFESEHYAASRGYRTSCCGCPACKFPSRRDIVEESILRFYEGPLWEFKVPGLLSLLAHFGVQAVAEASAPGLHFKHPHLPAGFGQYVVKYFRDMLYRKRAMWEEMCDATLDLDRIGSDRLRARAPLVDTPRVPLPAILSGRSLDANEESMIATMGPFWGAIGLNEVAACRSWELQRALVGFSCDERWGQVTRLLNLYYGMPSPEVRQLPQLVSSTCGGCAL